MNITEIVEWLKKRYNTTFVLHSECFIIQVICYDKTLFEQYDLQRVIYIMYCDDIPASGLVENGNYIIIGTDITNNIPSSNCLTIPERIDKQMLCNELNILIAEKAMTYYRLASLNKYLLSDDFVELLMDYFFEQFHNHISYVDYSHHVISYRPHEVSQEFMKTAFLDNTLKYGRYDPQMIDDNFQHYVDIVVRSPSPFHTKLFEFDYYVWTIKNVAELYGFFVMLATKQPMTRDDLSIISTAADLIALKMGNSGGASGKGNYSEILNDLLSDNIKTEYELNYRMLTRTWKRSEHYQIFLIDLHGEGEKYIQYIKKGIQAVSKKIKHITYEEYELILIEETSFKNDELTKIIDNVKQYKIVSGLSDTFNSLFDIKIYYEQAKKAIILGARHGAESEVMFKYSDYRFYDFLYECANSMECKNFYHPVTMDLELYDVEHKTEFYKTLLTYLECGRSIHKTCAKMFLHKNTVNYRIQRIKELFNLDYDDGQAVLFIYLSLKLYAVNKIKG